MRFDVLGPLRVHTDHGPLHIDAPKQRRLLAVLLAGHGTPISTEALIEAVWPDRPPTTARKALGWHLHQLRETLGDRDLVIRRDGGYQLDVAPECIDYRRFEVGVTTASQLAASEPTGAAAQLQHVLDLWRGPAFGGLADGVLRPEADRLDELRLTAVEQWTELKLQIGHHLQLVSDLPRFVAEFPYREALRAGLMLALYRAGRTADALDVYREGRRLMSEELGLDPGLRLRELEQAILTDAPDIAVPSTVSHTPRRESSPAELPVDVTEFVGRTELATRIEREITMDDGSRVVAVNGPGGVGKSALAVHVASRIAHRFPDGQLYVNLHGATAGATPLNPVMVLTRFLRSLQEPVEGSGGDADELAARFRSLTRSRRILILLDDAADSAQLRPLLPAGDGCRVIITSRAAPSTLENVRHHDLNMLSADESRQLLVRLLGDNAATVTDPVREIADLCGGMPLALRLAAARITARGGWSVSRLLSTLRREHRRLGALQLEDLAVRSSLMISYRELRGDRHDSAAAALFRALGGSDVIDAGLDLVTALCDGNADAATDLIDRLIEVRLLDEHRPGRFRMHDLVRLLARELAEQEAPEQRAESVRLLRHHYLATVRNALRATHPELDKPLSKGPQELVTPGAACESPAEAEAWISAELHNLVAVVRQAGTEPADGPSVALCLASTLKRLLTLRGQWQLLTELTETAVGIATDSGSRYQLAQAHFDLGELRVLTGDPAAGLELLEQTVSILRTIEKSTMLGDALIYMSIAHRELGNGPEAICAAQEAIPVTEGISHVSAIDTLANAHWEFGETTEAERCFRLALEANTENGSRTNRAIILGNFGHFLTEMDRPDEALALLTEAQDIVSTDGHAATLVAADIRWAMGDAEHQLKQTRPATAHWRAAAAVLRDIDLLTDSEYQELLRQDHPQRPAALS